MLQTHDDEDSPDVPLSTRIVDQYAGHGVLLIRLITVTVIVGFVLGLVYLGVDPYMAVAAGIAVTVAAVRMTRR